MARSLDIEKFTVSLAAGSVGFNEWKANIYLYTTDPSTICNIRFIDPDEITGHDTIVESGITTIYQHIEFFDRTLHLLQSEEPLKVVLYESATPGESRVLIDTGAEEPGQNQ